MHLVDRKKESLCDDHPPMPADEKAFSIPGTELKCQDTEMKVRRGVSKIHH